MKNECTAYRTVREIKTQVRNPNRKTVIFDDGSFIGISEELFFSNSVHVGDELSLDKIEELTYSEQNQKLKNYALKLLSYRMRSRAELKQRLLQKDFPDVDVEQLLSDFEKKNYLNDAEFAFAFSRDKVKIKGIGPLALKSELFPFKLNAEMVENTVAKIYSEYSIDSLLESHLKKRKIKKNTHLLGNEKNRLLQFLYRKGFSWEDISRLMQKHNIS